MSAQRRDELNGLGKAELEAIAERMSLDVKGTGANGNVVKDDLVKAILKAEAKAETETPAEPVEVPEGVVPGETPGWPVDAETGEPLQLTDEQREQVAALDPPLTDPVDDFDALLARLESNAASGAEGSPAHDSAHGGSESPSSSASAPVTDVSPGDVVPIARTSESTWWCPVCDHSQLHGADECANCHAERNGDEVIVRGAA